LKPLDLSLAFRADVRHLPKETRAKIGRALQLLERDFGHPHRHQGLGIRKLTATWFELRIGLDVRIVFQHRPDCLWFGHVGNHDEVRKFLRGL
jgi:mRNA-degrading endonuclease YafQ of YafQ-DinJ toxin-antitoxin module